MLVAIASDHAGLRLKQQLLPTLDAMGLEYKDFGCFDETSVDYPDYGRQVAERIATGEFDRGILICGTGLGMAITANKVPNVRAVTAHDVFSATMSRLHNDANILTMGERVIGPGLAAVVLETWLKTDFEGGRHAKRLSKVSEIEAQYSRKE